MAATLEGAVRAAKEDLLDEPLVRLLRAVPRVATADGRLDRRLAAAREGLWEQARPYLEVWCRRKAQDICHGSRPRLAEPFCRLEPSEESLATAAQKLGAAVRHILLAIAVVEDGNRLAADRLLGELLPRLEYLAWRFQARGRQRGLTQEDLLNEACLKFHRSIGRFDPYHPSCPMVGTFVVNMVLNHLRDATSERQADRYARGRGHLNETDDELRSSYRQRAWEQHASECQRRDNRETRDAVGTICARLVDEAACKPEKVMAFRLWFFRNLGYAEIGQYMRETTGAGSTGWAHGAVHEVARLVLGRLDPDRLAPADRPTSGKSSRVPQDVCASQREFMGAS